MFLEAKKCITNQHGNVTKRTIKVNTEEISSIEECGYECRPYDGYKKVSITARQDAER